MTHAKECTSSYLEENVGIDGDGTVVYITVLLSSFCNLKKKFNHLYLSNHVCKYLNLILVLDLIMVLGFSHYQYGSSLPFPSRNAVKLYVSAIAYKCF